MRESWSTKWKAPSILFVRSAGWSVGFPVTFLINMFCWIGVRIQRRASTAEVVSLPPNFSFVRVSRIDHAMHNLVATIFSSTLLKH